MQQIPSQSDLVIVGAGPHALSMALRWIQGSVGNFSDHERVVQHYLKNKENAKQENKRQKLTVIDPAGEWMAKWNSLFDCLDIHFLRSTMFMHPDTFDLYSFLAFAHSTGRDSELIPITELYCEHQLPISEQKRKKKERTQYKGFSLFPENRRELFFRPSQSLFKNFCEDLVQKYQLSDVVVRGSVISTEIMKNGRICVTLDTQQKIEAKYVVFATGFSQPLFPSWFPALREKSPARVMHSGQWCAKIQEIKRNKAKQATEEKSNEKEEKKCEKMEKEMKKEESEDWTNKEELRGKKVLVVGGGLTSAHLISVAAKMGFGKIVLVSRKYLVQKLFDLDLSWMGACRNLQYSKFWNQPEYEGRIKMIKEARGGGSITFDARKHLIFLQESGILEIRENCEVESAEAEENSIKVIFKNCGNPENTNCGNPESFDYMWVATGSKIDILQEPYLRSYFQSHTIASECGFPILDQNLKLHPNHNIFVMGGYASLQLGPDARNLSGCRNAADRICAFIEENSKSENSSGSKHSKNSTGNSKNAKNSKNSTKDKKWSNFGNEDFNAFSILAEDCDQ